jgi:hypothetical protein
MGCTITEIDSDEDMELARVLYDEAVNKHPQDSEEIKNTQIMVTKRNSDSNAGYQIPSRSIYQPSPMQLHVNAPLQESPNDRMQLWPFNYQNEFSDYSPPKRIRRIYVPRQVVRIISPSTPMFRYIPTRRLVLSPTPIVPPVYVPSNYVRQRIEPDDEDELTK